MKVYIAAATRTAIGSFQGGLSTISAPSLGAAVVRSLLQIRSINPESIDQLIMGTVISAGQGQAPARQVTINSGLPTSVHSLTINKVCSSGLTAIMIAADQIRLGAAQAVIAGGMESMSNAPYLLPAMRQGARYGNQTAEDSIIRDALWDTFNQYIMGSAAELCAREKKISRQQQDDYAVQSYTRALDAIRAGYFKDEITPITVKKGKEDITVDTDEEPFKAILEKIPTLKPAFDKEGTVTAANASSLNDGAAAVLVCSEEYLKKNSIAPIAEIKSYCVHSQAPEWFTTAPIGALQKLLKTSKIPSIDALDLVEINEAFACVAIACRSELNLDPSKLNINGGAVALGHPVGTSGARIVVTLLNSLKRIGKTSGAVAICNGGGEASAMLLERL